MAGDLCLVGSPTPLLLAPVGQDRDSLRHLPGREGPLARKPPHLDEPLPAHTFEMSDILGPQN